MLLVVSLDSENADWLQAHMASGTLPNLASLARSGTILPVDAAALAGLAYPTLYGGIGPAQHGQYFPLQWNPREQRIVVASFFPYPETILTRMDRAGKRVVVLDPPELEPLALRHGYAVSGLQFRARVLLHDWSSDAPRTARLLRPIGPSPRADEVFGAIIPSDMRHLRQALLQAPARLQSAALAALQDPPDCLWLNCCALHLAGHQFYELPSIGDRTLRAELEGTRLDLARGYDRMLGEVLAVLPAGAAILIAYAKGMGKVPHWADLLPQMLRRVLGEQEARPPVNFLRVALPRPLRRWLADRLSDDAALRMMAKLSTPRLDWQRTRAFCLPTDYPGFIQFNVHGRERDGLVKPSELPELEQQIRDGLATFTDEQGQPCVDRIFRPEEMFGTGPRLGQLPDLIVRWRRDSPAPSSGVRSPRFGSIQRTVETVGRSGNHIPGAFSILAGNRRPAPPDGVMRMEDISATILHGVGMAVPELPGRPFWQ
ncbi:MAG: hypothetical protein JNK87_04620 [Bryobacterales bacterium]|nr:hypothetical protein [Bryobacterales bacterium]